MVSLEKIVKEKDITMKEALKEKQVYKNEFSQHGERVENKPCEDKRD